MKRITIHKTDLKVSPLCLGADKFGSGTSKELSYRILDCYRDMGGNFIDTAAVYGRWLPHGENVSEQILGGWLKDRGAGQEMIVATKGGHYPLSDRSVSRVTRQEIARDIEDSLRALGLDTLDFYWLHRDDPQKPIGEIIEMMEDFRRAGLIRYYGASNYTAARLEAASDYAVSHGITGFSAVSNKWSPAKENPGVVPVDPTLVQFEDGDLDLFRRTGMSFIPYNATAKGYFEKRYRDDLSPIHVSLYQNEENDALYARLKGKRDRTQCPMQTLLLAEMMNGYGIQIIPITSVSKTEQLEALRELLC